MHAMDSMTKRMPDISIRLNLDGTVARSKAPLQADLATEVRFILVVLLAVVVLLVLGIGPGRRLGGGITGERRDPGDGVVPEKHRHVSWIQGC